MMYLFIVVILLLAIFYKRTLGKPMKFPPGPSRIPLLGSYPGFLKKRSLIENIKDLVDEYGPLCGLYIGNRRVVIIADYEILKDVFQMDEASGRPTNEPANENRIGWECMNDLNYGEMPGVLMSGGTYWKEQRRFLLRYLKDFGFGKSSMESLITEEMEKLCKKLSLESMTGPVNLRFVMNVSIVNSLWKILMGDRLELDDPKLLKVIQMFDEFFRKTSGNISPKVALLPWPKMAKWPFLREITEHSTRQSAYKEVNKFIEPFIKEHQNTLDYDNIRDFTDKMLIEIQKTSDPRSSFFGKKGFFSLFNNIIDLFIAGSETTTSSLLWLFLYLIHHPEIQAKVHEELDKVVGRSRSPSLKDKPNLNYFNAVLHESLRATCLGGAGIPHYTSADIKVKDFIIPKDTIIFGSLYHILHNEKYFEDPHTFNPERFLDHSGHFVPSKHMVAFGVGKRVCLGQSLAEQEFFLFAAGILSQFKIEHAPGHVIPSYFIEEQFPSGTVRVVPRFSVNLKARY